MRRLEMSRARRSEIIPLTVGDIGYEICDVYGLYGKQSKLNNGISSLISHCVCYDHTVCFDYKYHFQNVPFAINYLLR